MRKILLGSAAALGLACGAATLPALAQGTPGGTGASSQNAIDNNTPAVGPAAAPNSGQSMSGQGNNTGRFGASDGSSGGVRGAGTDSDTSAGNGQGSYRPSQESGSGMHARNTARTGSAEHYLRAAERSIAANHLAEAHHALEMAETRLLNRAGATGQPNQPVQDPAVQQVEAALKALSAHDRAAAKSAVQAALQQASAGSLASGGTSTGEDDMNAAGTASGAPASQGAPSRSHGTIGHSLGGTRVGESPAGTH